MKALRDWSRTLEWPLMWKSTHHRKIAGLSRLVLSLQQKRLAERSENGNYV